MIRKMLVLALAAALALAVVGCSESTDADGGATTDEPRTPVEGALSAETLPTEAGYAWDVGSYFGPEPIAVNLTVDGPWTLLAGEGWTVATTEIVDPADVTGLDAFPEYDFVVRTSEFGEEAYFPRQATDEWLLQLGRVSLDGAAEPYEEPLKLWPLNFKVGDSFVVADGGSFRIDATVLAKSTATVPAGEIPDAYLLRYEYTPLAEGAIEGTQYYILAPEVGFVAAFSALAGDEASGFTTLETASVLMTRPEKR